MKTELSAEQKLAMMLLHKSLLEIRTITKKDHLSKAEIKKINDIADACHNTPYCFTGVFDINNEIYLMKKALKISLKTPKTHHNH